MQPFKPTPFVFVVVVHQLLLSTVAKVGLLVDMNKHQAHCQHTHRLQNVAEAVHTCRR